MRQDTAWMADHLGTPGDAGMGFDINAAFLQYLALAFAAICVFEIHCLALMGLISVHKPCSKERIITAKEKSHQAKILS